MLPARGDGLERLRKMHRRLRLAPPMPFHLRAILNLPRISPRARAAIPFPGLQCRIVFRAALGLGRYLAPLGSPMRCAPKASLWERGEQHPAPGDGRGEQCGVAAVARDRERMYLSFVDGCVPNRRNLLATDEHGFSRMKEPLRRCANSALALRGCFWAFPRLFDFRT